MWGFVIGALVLAWVVLGMDVLSGWIDSEVLVWSIYLGVIVAWLLLGMFLHRGSKARQLKEAADRMTHGD